MKCTAHKPQRSGGAPCANEAVEGTSVCEAHGALAPRVARKAEVVRAKRALDAYIEPIPADDPEARDPLLALENLRRKTISRIRFLEAQIAEQLDLDTLQFGLTKEEQVNATEFAGTNRTFEARVPVLVQLLRDENATLVKITELEAKTAFQQAKLTLQQQSQQQAIELGHRIVLDLVKALGRKPDDPRVRRAISRVLGGGTGSPTPLRTRSKQT